MHDGGHRHRRRAQDSNGVEEGRPLGFVPFAAVTEFLLPRIVGYCDRVLAAVRSEMSRFAKFACATACSPPV